MTSTAVATRLPAIFVSHGSPTTVIDKTGVTAFFRKLGSLIQRPKAILVISAHWEQRTLSVSGAENPATIHDFGGFPAELYQMKYPAPGSPEVAKRVAELTGASIHPSRGLDHGAWIPLKLIYPAADIPVLQLTVLAGGSAEAHYKIGQQLAPLRDEGVLIVGSGGLFHSFEYFFEVVGEGVPFGTVMSSKPKPWVTEYCNWMQSKLVAGDVKDLLKYRALAPHAREAHPTEEHIVPLHVALGAANGAPARVLFDDEPMVAAYAFD